MDGIGRNCSLRKTGFHPESSPGQAFSAICSRRIAHTIAAAGLALACAGPLLGQTAAVPIAAMAIGAPPADFEFWRTGQGAPGEWVVVRDATAAAWHSLSLKAEEARFTVSFDGKTLYTATDAMLSDAGRIALWTKADSVTPFDRIEVKVLP
jgi:hypothetical protein